MILNSFYYLLNKSSYSHLNQSISGPLEKKSMCFVPMHVYVYVCYVSGCNVCMYQCA